MDIIYHRNCLDGVYSSFLLYLLSKVITEEQVSRFIKFLKSMKTQDVTQIFTSEEELLQKGGSQSKQIQIDQFFFNDQTGVAFSAYSFFAGQYYSLSFKTKAKLLIIVDTNLVSAKNIKQISSRYDATIMIDHHTSFKQIVKELQYTKIPNFYYILNQDYCASELALFVMNKFFGFHKLLQKRYYQNLNETIDYVAANDLKNGQSRQSKRFVLGFYYFGIELSHMNPLLYKRVGTLDLEYVLQKGKNLYENHLDMIQKQISNACVCQFTCNGPFKNKLCLVVEPMNPKIISDVGSVLAYISSSMSMENLCILYIGKKNQSRFSCRSHKFYQKPRALEFAKRHGGGGHTQAAGFKVSWHKFKSETTFKPITKDKLTFSKQAIEQILFKNKK